MEKKRQVKLLSGNVPSPLRSPSGCTLHPHCSLRTGACRERRPDLVEAAPSHRVACLVRGGQLKEVEEIKCEALALPAGLEGVGEIE